jgi:hypothetical protein
MPKSTIARLWWGGLAGIAAGLIVAGISFAVMMTLGGTFNARPDGKSYDFIPNYGPTFWWTVTTAALGGLIALAGGVAQFVGWIGALVNSWRLPEKAWFVLLLVLGIIGHVFGLVMMIVYLLAGPDSTKLQPAPQAPSPTPQPGRIVPA